MRPDQRASHRYPCPVCGGTEQCLRYTSNGRFCMCQNPPAKLRGYPVKHLSTFGKDFWVIPLDRVGKVQEPSEEEAVDRWPGYPRAYQSLIDHLRLSKPWYRHLSQRGFTKAEITDLEYRSLPDVQGTLDIADQLYRIYTDVWTRIPGFGFNRRGCPCFFAMEHRLVIPIRDPKHRIIGIQTRRLPDDTTSPKYTWLDKGGLVGTPFHHIGDSQVLLLTEGPLKADFVHLRTGWQVISWQGVSCLKGIGKISAIAQSKDTVYLANDLDLFDNPAVMRATKEAIAWLEPQVKVQVLLWEGPKGIDDYIAKGGQVFEVHTPQILDEEVPCQRIISI